MASNIFDYECFAETILFAESLGFKGGWDDAHPDAHEQAAIEYIESRGYAVKYGEDE
jgi:hypothetical protein